MTATTLRPPPPVPLAKRLAVEASEIIEESEYLLRSQDVYKSWHPYVKSMNTRECKYLFVLAIILVLLIIIV